MEEGVGFERRELLRRGAIAGGVLGGLAVLPGLVREAYGEPLEVPDEERSFEGGMADFAASWTAAGPVIALSRFGPYLNNKIFNCRVSGQARSFALRLTDAGATLTPGIDPFRHVDVVMPEEDWLGCLYGDYSGFAPFVNGDMHPTRDGSNKAVLLLVAMYIFAHIPAGQDPDPELLLSIFAGLVQRGGLPECDGQPAFLEALEELQEDPEAELLAQIAPSAGAPAVTRTIAEFVAGLRYDDIPPGAIASAKEQLLSILGAIWAGSRMPPARKFGRAVRGFGERGEATVIGERGFRTSARHAALMNSVHAQILEWEDWTFIAHSGASIVPTALAAGELGDASGAELLAAIVAGNEILARSGEVLTDVIHTGNAVPTHQMETPFVAGKLLGLDAGRLQDAVGICCVQPQVTSIPTWTSESKGLLTGWPVLTAVEAAQYAAAGIHGRRDILESPGGYCFRVSDVISARRLEKLIEGLGEEWRFDAARNELFTKRYPTDGFQLTAVQAILDIVNSQAPDVFGSTPRRRLPDLVKRIRIRMPLVMAGSATMFSKGTDSVYDRIRDDPGWSYIALLFDGKYPIAAALANRRLTFREYSEEAIFDPIVQALVDKVELVADLSLGVFGADALVELSDGRTFTSTQECIEDFPVREKLEIGAGGLLSKRQIRRIVRAVNDLENLDVRSFVRIAAGR